MRKTVCYITFRFDMSLTQYLARFEWVAILHLYCDEMRCLTVAFSFYLNEPVPLFGSRAYGSYENDMSPFDCSISSPRIIYLRFFLFFHLLATVAEIFANLMTAFRAARSNCIASRETLSRSRYPESWHKGFVNYGTNHYPCLHVLQLHNPCTRCCQTRQLLT